MQFIPQWISDVPISDVRVQIVLPPDVTVSDVKTTENFYNGTSTVEGRLAVYWEKPVIQANEQFMVGVSFPSRFMPNYNPPQTGGGFDFGIFGAIIGSCWSLVCNCHFSFNYLGQLAKAPMHRPKLAWKLWGLNVA